MPHRCAQLVVVLFVAAAVVGCGQPTGVRATNVPRAAEPTAKDGAHPYRMLAAMVPADDPVWFFKLSGPTDVLTKHEAGFDQLVASIRYKDEKTPPEFAAPEGWKLGGPRGAGMVKVAQTVKLPDPAFEVTLVASGGGVGQNLDRWVGMLGLKPGLSDQARFTKAVDAAGGKVLRVDIRGPKNPNAGGGPMTMGKRG